MANGSPTRTADNARLRDGSRVAVIGSGPAGSFFAYFLLEMSRRVGMTLDVDLYEAREFTQPSPQGCNMCGGIVSETLVQNLAAEGIVLAPDVIQRAISGYVLHMDVGTVRIEAPTVEKRIGAVHRGAGPKNALARRWESFDGHLQAMATAAGARLVPARVDAVSLADGRPVVRARRGEATPYDLLAVCAGVNSPTLKLFESLGIGYRTPSVTKTLIREYHLGDEVISRTIGASMHVFLLKIPRLEFAAIIPKGEFVTMCLLGDDIDSALVDAFVTSPEVVACMPPGWDPDARACQCRPHINVGRNSRCFADRIVFVGDCGATRLYKDGIGAAYRTAKAAARTAVFQGVAAKDFAQHFEPVCRTIVTDNLMGRAAFKSVRLVQSAAFLRRAILRMTAAEQSKRARHPRMSGILWDLFSGSAPYADICARMFHPALIARMLPTIVASIASKTDPPSA